jgi:uncharacterized protein (TIGR00251 family)
MQLKLTTQPGRVLVDIHVIPRAKRSAIVGVHDGRLKVALLAPPVDGAANQALVELFAKLLGCPRKDIELLRGDKSRQKTLAIHGVSAEQICALLAAS